MAVRTSVCGERRGARRWNYAAVSACTVARMHEPLRSSLGYCGGMDYEHKRHLDVQIALAADPDLARELTPRPIGPGRWAIVVEDWSRGRAGRRSRSRRRRCDWSEGAFR